MDCAIVAGADRYAEAWRAQVREGTVQLVREAADLASGGAEALRIGRPVVPVGRRVAPWFVR